MKILFVQYGIVKDSTVVGNLPTKLDMKPLSDITQSHLNHSSTSADNSTAPPLKKRGRPRKYQSLPVVHINSSTNNGVNKCQSHVAPLQNKPQSTSNMKPTVLPPPLRKRGRPKKVCPSPIMQTFSSPIGSTQMHDSTPISQDINETDTHDMTQQRKRLRPTTDYNHHSSASNLASVAHADQSSPINETLPHLTPSRHDQIKKSITFNNNATRNLLSTFSEVGKHLENPQPLPDQPVGQEATVHASSSSRVDVVDIPLSKAFEP
ncbi:hypothetical protein P8452_52170 [Trifolium repens]|nr:hypothetical protein P8452_52170 [Trifolium repens]